MDKHAVILLLAAISAARAYIIPHVNTYSHEVHGKVFVPYPAYFGHIPLGHHPHVVHTPVFVISHGPHPAGKPSVPGSIPGHHPGNVPVYPPHFPGVHGVLPDSGPGISIPPLEPRPDGGPHLGGGSPIPSGPECTLCSVGGGRGGGGGNGNGVPVPTPDEGGRGEEDPAPGETPRAGVPPAEDGAPKPEEPAPETPKPEEPAPETPKPEEPAPETPKPEEPAPETPKPEEPVPETTPMPEEPAPETPKPEEPTTEAPKPEEPAPEEPATEEPKPEEPAPEEPKPEEEQKPEREEPKPDEEKSSEEDGAQATETAPSVDEPPPARLQLPKKATSAGKNRKGAATARVPSARRKTGVFSQPLRVVPVLNFHRGMPYIQPLLASSAHFEKPKGDLTAQEGRYAFEYFLPAHGPLVPHATGVIQRPLKALVRLQG